MSVLMAFTAAVLFGIGTYLVLQRKLSRLIIGLGLDRPRRQHRVRHRDAPRRSRRSSAPATRADFADPLPQALVLTAIVISFGVTALLLALAYRSWLLTRDDEVAGRRRGPQRRPRLPDAEVADAGAAELAVDRRARPIAVNALLPLPIVLPLLAAALCILTGGSRAAAAHHRPDDAHRARADLDRHPRARRRRRHRRRAGRRLAGADRHHARRRPPVGDHARDGRRSCCSPCCVYAIGQPGVERNHVGFQSVYMVLAAGVAGRVPHRRPVQPVRRHRDDADGELRPASRSAGASTRCAPA